MIAMIITVEIMSKCKKGRERESMIKKEDCFHTTKSTSLTIIIAKSVKHLCNTDDIVV